MHIHKLFSLPVLILLLLCFGPATPKYAIERRYYDLSEGVTIYYLVNDQSVKVDIDCDFEDCSRKNVYLRKLSPAQSDSLLQTLKVLHLDTLKANYKPKAKIYDGFASLIKLRGPNIPDKEISINNVHVPVIDSLQKIIDGLIWTRKYQLAHFGQD